MERADPAASGRDQRELGAPTNILATRLRELHAAGILYRVPLAHNVLAYALTEHAAALGETIAPWRDGARQGSSDTRQRRRAPTHVAVLVALHSRVRCRAGVPGGR